MRKFTFILPVFAILMAVVVLGSDVGSSLSAATPAPTTTDSVGDVDYANSEDISATTWTETGFKNIDTRKPNLPSAPKKKHTKKK